MLDMSNIYHTNSQTSSGMGNKERDIQGIAGDHEQCIQTGLQDTMARTGLQDSKLANTTVQSSHVRRLISSNVYLRRMSHTRFRLCVTME